MAGILAAILLLAASPDEAAALADRAKFPSEDHAYLYYFSTSSVPAGETREQLENALRFTVPSLSREVALSAQLPMPVTPTLWRIDTRGLGWEFSFPKVIQEHYPYGHGPELKWPLVIDALWFVANLPDAVETKEAQYQLIYGVDGVPKTMDEFLKFWGAQNEAEFLFGVIAADSPVANNGERLLENRPGAKRNVVWLTRDSRVVAGEFDPLENLPNKAKFDAQEAIATLPASIGRHTGKKQFYFLAAGDGARQDKAPADIVQDYTDVRGVEIRNTISCIICHPKGINPVAKDAFKDYLRSGARVFADRKSQIEIDRYLEAGVDEAIAEDQKAYDTFVALCNGQTGETNAAHFAAMVRYYDAPVGLEQAARELYVPVERLRLRLAAYAVRQGSTARLAKLAEGGKISRAQYLQNFSTLFELTWE